MSLEIDLFEQLTRCLSLDKAERTKGSWMLQKALTYMYREALGLDEDKALPLPCFSDKIEEMTRDKNLISSFVEMPQVYIWDKRRDILVHGLDAFQQTIEHDILEHDIAEDKIVGFVVYPEIKEEIRSVILRYVIYYE